MEQQLDPRDWVVWVDPRQIRQLFKKKPKTGHGEEQQLGYYDSGLGRRRGMGKQEEAEEKRRQQKTNPGVVISLCGEIRMIEGVTTGVDSKAALGF